MAKRISQLDDRTRALLQAAANEASSDVARSMRHLHIVWGLSFTVFAIVLFSLYRFRNLPLWSGPLFAFAAPATMVVSVAVVVWIWRDAGPNRYKSILVRRVVEALGEGATYSPDARITAGELNALDVFPNRAGRVYAADQISGKRGDVRFRYLEVSADGVLREGGPDPDHPGQFVGYLLVLEFNKHFRGHTVVVPDAAVTFLEVESTRGRKARVTMENPEFERTFTVYSTDDQQARYVLTPKLQELLLATRKRLGRDLRACFLGGSLVLACSSTRDRFEPSLGGKVDPQRVATELQEVLTLVDQVIEAMDLETRIWTRA